MPATPIYALPYPALADDVNVPQDVQALALAVEAVIAALQGVPPGTSLSYRGASTPSGYLWEDGSAVSRTGATAALFAAMGTLHGVGNGSTTFNIADSRGRGDVGQGTHADVATVGLNDGHAVANRRPKHRHPVTDPGHGHAFRWHDLGTTFAGLANLIGINQTAGRTGADVSPYEEIASGVVPAAATGITVGAAADFADAAPYLVARKIVKT